MIHDEGVHGLVIRSVARPDTTIHSAEYKGHWLRVLENSVGDLRIDKAWNPQGQEVNPASLGELDLRLQIISLRPYYTNRWGYDPSR